MQETIEAWKQRTARMHPRTELHKLPSQDVPILTCKETVLQSGLQAETRRSYSSCTEDLLTRATNPSRGWPRNHLWQKLFFRGSEGHEGRHHAGIEPETRSSSDSPSHGYSSSLPRASAIPNTHTSSTPHSSVANGSTTIPSNVHNVAWRTSSRRSDAHSPRRPHRRHSADGAGANATPLATFSVFNVQGLKPRTVPSKVPFLKDLLHQGNQLFIALSETWLRDHRDAEVAIDGYTIFRQDRQPSRNRRRGRDSGGVAFYVRDDMAATAEPVLNFSNGVVEVLGLSVGSSVKKVVGPNGLNLKS